MGAGMDDSIHIKVKVINGRDGRCRPKATVENVGVLVSEPSEHFGDAKQSRGGNGGWRVW